MALTIVASPSREVLMALPIKRYQKQISNTMRREMKLREKFFQPMAVTGKKEIIQNNYTYNVLGQQIKKNVTLNSEKIQRQTEHTRKKRQYTILFGNCLSTTDEDGLVTKTSYDPETGDKKRNYRGSGDGV